MFKLLTDTKFLLLVALVGTIALAAYKYTEFGPVAQNIIVTIVGGAFGNMMPQTNSNDSKSTRSKTPPSDS